MTTDQQLYDPDKIRRTAAFILAAHGLTREQVQKYTRQHCREYKCFCNRCHATLTVKIEP